MCAIAGYISKENHLEELKRAVTKLTHRGPDDEGFYTHEFLAFGFRRLSIIDVVAGKQPMSYENGVIVFNGEIYNFLELKEKMIEDGIKFSTRSDTEVLLKHIHHYGYEETLSAINGMFAFAYYDKKKKELFLARDRAGKKPLYYYIDGERFAFASEIKALLEFSFIPKELDEEAFIKYLFYGYVPAPYSIFKKIKKLEAGTYMTVNERLEIKKKKYWKLEYKPVNFNKMELMEELREKLHRAVKLRLISDVPLGVFLSGGIDSSLVASIASKYTSKLKTFSIGFFEKEFSELEDAKKTAEFIGSEHYYDILSPQKAVELVPKIIDYLDEPFADPSIIPTFLLSQFTRKYVTVAVGGDGGDEVFAGYPTYFAHILHRFYSKQPEFLKKIERILIENFTPPSYKYFSWEFKLKKFLSAEGSPAFKRHLIWMSYINDKELYALTGRSIQLDGEADDLNSIMLLDFNTYLTDDILFKVDRASMANSLEVRAPILDKDVLLTAFRIPAELKINPFKTKIILKETFKDELPPHVFKKKKHGFSIPVAKWINSDIKDLFNEVVDINEIKKDGVMNYAIVSEWIDEHRNMKVNRQRQLWCIFMFMLFKKRWM